MKKGFLMLLSSRARINTYRLSQIHLKIMSYNNAGEKVPFVNG